MCSPLQGGGGGGRRRPGHGGVLRRPGWRVCSAQEGHLAVASRVTAAGMWPRCPGASSAPQCSVGNPHPWGSWVAGWRDDHAWMPWPPASTCCLAPRTPPPLQEPPISQEPQGPKGDHASKKAQPGRWRGRKVVSGQVLPLASSPHPTRSPWACFLCKACCSLGFGVG